MQSLVFLALLTVAPARAQGQPGGGFSDLGQKVAQELQDYTGYNFTGNRSDGRPGEGPAIIAVAARHMRSGNEQEIQYWLVKPMLRIESLLNPSKAIDAEAKFWQARGYGFSNATKQEAWAAFNSAALASPSGSADNPGGREAGFNAASDVLFAKATSKQWMNMLMTAQRAYAGGVRMAQLYNLDSDSSEYGLTRGLRDADLGALGFIHTNKAVQPQLGILPAQLVPPGDEPVSMGAKLRNINMFKGFAAAVVLNGATQGLLPNAPPKAELKQAIKNEDSQWGFSMLNQFTSQKNAEFLTNLAADADK